VSTQNWTVLGVIVTILTLLFMIFTHKRSHKKCKATVTITPYPLPVSRQSLYELNTLIHEIANIPEEVLDAENKTEINELLNVISKLDRTQLIHITLENYSHLPIRDIKIKCKGSKICSKREDGRLEDVPIEGNKIQIPVLDPTSSIELYIWGEPHLLSFFFRDALSITHAEGVFKTFLEPNKLPLHKSFFSSCWYWIRTNRIFVISIIIIASSSILQVIEKSETQEVSSTKPSNQGSRGNK
jgi:hypothetical protein